MNVTRRKVYDFRGAGAPPASGSPDGGPFVKTITGSGTVAPSGGDMALALDNTNEVQNNCLSFGDNLAYDINDLLRVEILAKVSDSLNAAVTAIVGVAAARNDDPDAIAAGVFFKVDGGNALVVESDDGTNDNNDVATGLTWGDAYKRLIIDFAQGGNTVSPPSQSVGGLAHLRFRAEDANGYATPIARNTRFDVSNYSAGLQLIAQIQKTSSTATGTLSIREVCVEYKVR